MKTANIVAIAARKITQLSANPRSIVRRIEFLAAAVRSRKEIGTWLETNDVEPGGLVSSLADRPEMIGIVQWPYLHNGWDAGERFRVVSGHYSETRELKWLRLGVHEERQLLELGDVLDGLSVVLDRPMWFLREGELTLNLFMHDERVYSLAFTLANRMGERVAYVGGIQGRSLEGIQGVYKDITKALDGMRPRDFLVAVLQFVCEAAGVSKLLGVSDGNRHQRHRYFRNGHYLSNSANYDEIWLDRGGKPVDGGFYEIPISPIRRAETEIPANKRAMYRRRYALLDRVREGISQGSRSLTLRAGEPT